MVSLSWHSISLLTSEESAKFSLFFENSVEILMGANILSEKFSSLLTPSYASSFNIFSVGSVNYLTDMSYYFIKIRPSLVQFNSFFCSSILICKKPSLLIICVSSMLLTMSAMDNAMITNSLFVTIAIDHVS